MRVVAGSAKGVRLGPVPEGVRPVADRAREGLFSSLGDLTGARVLDLYAGTGAMGIEALSRGAREAVFVERSRRAIAAIRGNLQRARVGERATVLAMSAAAFLARDAGAHGPFDVVFCDPPYEREAPDLGAELRGLDDGDLLAPGSRVVVTRGSRSSTLVVPLHWRVARELRYGDSLLSVFQP